MVNELSFKSALVLDEQQAIAHLNALGYKSRDSIFMRYIHANPVDGQPKSIKRPRLNWKECESYQSQGYDAYFVVNGGGDNDAAVKVGRAIFYEHDDLSKDIQRSLWQNLGLPEPTIQVDTGGKSIHSYWVFHQPIGIKDWCELQEDLLEFADGDRSIKNPSRILRLAGCRYMKGDNPGLNIATIITASGKRYSYLELRDVIQVQKTQVTSPLDSIKLPVSEPVPLELCLTKRSREMLASGTTAPDKQRNDSGIELARDLIGTTTYLEKIRQAYNGNPEILFFDWCRAVALDTDKPKGQPEGIWKSASKDNPSPGSGEDGVQACVKGWHWNTNLKPSGKGFRSRHVRSSGRGGDDGGDGGDRTSSKILRFPGADPATLEQVAQEIDELINQGVSGSKLTAELNRLAAASQLYVGELRKLYQERLAESEIESDRDENHDEIQSLLNFNEQSLDLADYLPQSLAHPITQWCNWLSIRPAFALTAFFAGISSVHATGTELVLQRNQNFRVPSTIYAGGVAPTGQKKSPIFNNIIRYPLLKLREEKVAAYEAAMADYEAELKDWEESEDKGSKPQKPKDPTLYFFTNATGEAIPVQASKDPGKALLALIDELSGYFNSSNAYRSGRGSDKQDLLSYFDGTGQTVLRAGGIRVDVPKIYLSIFGTIQPEILKRYMEDCSDPDGNWARFLFVIQPLQASILHDDDGMAYQISDRLTHFYRLVDRLPEMEYRLSRRAFKAYQVVYNQLERLRVTHPKSGMAAVYSKMEGYIGRLALNLHVLWELEAGKEYPSEEIPLHIMQKAIALAKFYMGQVRLLHANADDESLPTHITKLIELSKRLEANGKDGWVKSKNFCEQFKAKKRPSAQQARQWMQEAVALGYGQTKGDKNRLAYHWNCDNNFNDNNPSPDKKLEKLGELGEHLGNTIPQVETIDNNGFEDNLGNLGNYPLSFLPSEISGDTPLAEKEEFSLEGDMLPLPSPALPQEAQSQDTASVLQVEESWGTTSPSVPQVPQPSLAPAEKVLVEEVQAAKLTPQVGQLDAIAAQFQKLELGRQLLQIDYAEFPVENSPATEEAYEIAQGIRAKILEINSAEDYEALRGSKKFTKEQLNWVRRNCLSKEERTKFQLIVTGTVPMQKKITCDSITLNKCDKPVVE